MSRYVANHPEMARLYASGLSLEAVATEFGCTVWIVRRALAATGVKSRRVGRPGGMSAETRAKAARMAEARARGDKLESIGAEHGVSKQAVHALLSRASA